LLANIFRIKSVLDAVILVVGMATVLALILVFALPFRLRQGEIQTIFKLVYSNFVVQYFRCKTYLLYKET